MKLPMKKASVAALAALVLSSCACNGGGTWNTASAASPVYYVSPNGNDGSSGTSENAPFRTIQKAADVAGAGSTILIRGGIYNESVTVRSSGSSSDGFISFQNYPGEKPVIDGTNLSVTDTGLFNIADKSYIRLKGFELRNLRAAGAADTPTGVQIQGTGHHIEVRDNYIHHIESGWKGGNAHGIAVFGTSPDQANNLNHIVIDHNEVADLRLGFSEAVAVNGNVDTFEVSNNKVHDNDNIGIVIIGHERKSPVAALDQARNGIVRGNAAYNNSSFGNSSYSEYSAGGIYIDGGKDLIIEQNDTHDNDIGIEVASEHAGKSASDVTVRNNLIYRNIMSGITLGGYDRYHGYTENCFFLNNTIYKNDTRAMGYGQITFNYDTRDNVFKNNVIYGSATNILVSNPFVENVGNDLDSNLYFTESGDQAALWNWNNVTYTGYANYKSASRNDSYSIFADPKLMNLTTPDLHVLSGSPAFNAGQNLPNIGGTDFDGKTRIQGGTVDIGAFETATATASALQGRQYPLHTDIIATTFWVGEVFDPSAHDGSQVFSTYYSEWMTHYGGCDGVITDKQCQTERRTADNDFFPTRMTPKMNPFYLDLPFDDLHDEIAFQQRAKVIPWANDPGYSGRADDKTFSYLKSRWVKLMRNGRTCYGQIEDAGPGQYHDTEYVFGSDDARPANTKFNGAGMDVSPALNGCLGFSELNGENDKVDWQFVDDIDVPTGPWKTLVTTEAITAASDAAVNVDLTAPDGVSGLSLGVTHTSLMWEQGDPAAVTSARKLLQPAVKYQNQHIMGFGADNPQPIAGGPFNFSSLDSRIQLMRSIGGEMVITFCTAPGWMKTSGQDWNMADRVADGHITDFANLTAAIAQRYPDVKYFQIWNEFKGYWDSSIKNSDGSTGNFDYVRYSQMYNAVYTAAKKVRPDAKVGGFYLPLGGDGSNTLGYKGDGTYTPIGTRDMDSLNYWLANKVGADFICADFGLIDWFNPNHLTADEGLALTWTYKKIIQDIEAKTNLPIWYSEYYSLPDAAYNGSPWVAAAMASIYYNMIKGEGTTPITALLWNPEEGEESCPHYLFTNTTPATGGQPTPHYYVYKGMHDYFPSGTQFYKATSSDPNVEVLASADKTMLINKYNTAKFLSVNGVEYTLTAYEVRFVDTPPEASRILSSVKRPAAREF